jgi:hypothetical protein
LTQGIWVIPEAIPFRLRWGIWVIPEAFSVGFFKQHPFAGLFTVGRAFPIVHSI